MFMTLARSPVMSQMPNMPEPASATAIGTPVSRHRSRTSMGSAMVMTFGPQPAPRQVAEGASCETSSDRPERTRDRSMSSMTVSARKPIGTKL